ncbi:MAG TPA: hypothetical protein VGK56_05415 [Anaerolineales bacterium]
METSDSYIVLERMIRQGEIAISELEPLLDSLEDQGQISSEEHESLLKLARELDIQNNSSG